jgi:hypothetical protein
MYKTQRGVAGGLYISMNDLTAQTDQKSSPLGSTEPNYEHRCRDRGIQQPDQYMQVPHW